MLVGAAAAVLVYIVFLVIYFFDDTIKTDEDVKNVLGLSVLGSIPNSEYVPARGYRYYNKYYTKYYGKRLYSSQTKEEQK